MRAVPSSWAPPRAASAMVDWGARPRPLATSPNCRSRSTMATRPRLRVSWMARLVATVVLPAPPLGDITVMTRPPGASSRWIAVWPPDWRRAAAAPARLRAWRISSSSAPTGMTSRTPARSARSSRPAVASATRTTHLGEVDVEGLGPAIDDEISGPTTTTAAWLRAISRAAASGSRPARRSFHQRGACSSPSKARLTCASNSVSGVTRRVVTARRRPGCAP